MDTRQLTYFLAVVDHQGFTAASAALRITQPALSNTVKQLEKECGVPLLHRLVTADDAAPPRRRRKA